MDAVLFDLDQTLVNSSALTDARRNRDWAVVLSRLDEVTLYDSAPHELLVHLEQGGIETGIVSASPRHYAEAILDRFGLEVDVLITGTDGYAPKPDPESLQAALAKFDIDASRAAYVGDDPFDFEAAAQAGMVAIGALWAFEDGRAPSSWRARWPDLAFRDPQMLLAEDEWPSRQLLAEATLSGQTPRPHRGSVLLHDMGFSLGRYFTTSDRRAAAPLSRALLHNKEAAPDALAFRAALELPLARMRGVRAGIVTNVPPAPEDSYDRFAALREAGADVIGGTSNGALLKQAFAVDEYKHVHGREGRDALNEGRFEVVRQLDGESVVLLDDVYRTGSQLHACRELLKRAGASKVVAITLGFSQEALLTQCPVEDCGGVLKYREGRFGPFWGCSRWMGGAGCGYTVSA